MENEIKAPGISVPPPSIKKDLTTPEAPENEAVYAPTEIALKRDDDSRNSFKAKFHRFMRYVIGVFIFLGLAYGGILYLTTPKKMKLSTPKIANDKSFVNSVKAKTVETKNWMEYKSKSKPVAIIIGKNANEYGVTSLYCKNNTMSPIENTADIEILDSMAAVNKFDCLMEALKSGKNGIKSGEISFAIIGYGIRSENTENNQILTDFDVFKPTIFTRSIEIKEGQIIDKETQNVFYGKKQSDEIAVTTIETTTTSVIETSPAVETVVIETTPITEEPVTTATPEVVDYTIPEVTVTEPIFTAPIEETAPIMAETVTTEPTVPVIEEPIMTMEEEPVVVTTPEVTVITEPESITTTVTEEFIMPAETDMSFSTETMVEATIPGTEEPIIDFQIETPETF